MSRNTYSEVDNRDAEQMFGYMEARIEALKRRILELQTENETLRSKEPAAFHVEGLENMLGAGIRLTSSRS